MREQGVDPQHFKIFRTGDGNSSDPLKSSEALVDGETVFALTGDKQMVKQDASVSLQSVWRARAAKKEADEKKRIALALGRQRFVPLLAEKAKRARESVARRSGMAEPAAGA